MDMMDHHLLNSAIRCLALWGAVELWHSRAASPDEGGLSQEDVDAIADLGGRYDLVLASYLDGTISLARAAEQIGMSSLELRTGFSRLGIPSQLAPANLEGVRTDAETALRLDRPDPFLREHGPHGDPDG